jgi:WD40 repeat protein
MEIEEEEEFPQKDKVIKQNENIKKSEGIIENMDMVFEEDEEISENEENDKFDEDEDGEDYDVVDERYKSDMDTFNSSVINKEEGEEDFEDNGDNQDNELPDYISHTFPFHKDSITVVKTNKIFNTIMASGGTDDYLNIIDLTKGELIKSEKFNETISLLDFSYDGKILAAYCIDDVIRTYEKDEENKFNLKNELETPNEEMTVI